MIARFRKSALVVALGAGLFAVCGPRRAIAQSDEGVAARANELIVAMEYDKARADLAKADPNSPSVLMAKARLALYEEDCDLAVALTSRNELAQNDEGRIIADVARGCARVTAATAVDKDEAAGVVIRWHDEADRALMPLMVDTVNKARVALTRDLGVEWKKPTRITVVRDLLSLSAMTGLPYKAAQTTGTVAVAKWGRVTILSPRASKHGYAWRDTLTHELTHLAISMQSRERAPLWLHEGVARRQETRWREPGPFDDRPSVESVVQRGMELKLDLPLDKLGPSIAMLPSADAAMVAFAEVASFVRFFVESQADGALAKLLVALRTTKNVDEALVQVSGETLSQWDVKWRANLARRTKEPLSPLYGLGGAPPSATDSRERSRLAELLLGRGHPNEALVELDKVPETLLSDPSVRYLRARVLEAQGDARAAEALVDDPKAWISPFGPCWAMHARLARARGDAPAAESASAEALAHDPFTVEAACSSLDPLPVSADPNAPVTQRAGSNDAPGGPLCDAARRRAEPDLGKD
jgi:tetratricopeptide (TPR) repeat protein